MPLYLSSPLALKTTIKLQCGCSCYKCLIARLVIRSVIHATSNYIVIVVATIDTPAQRPESLWRDHKDGTTSGIGQKNAPQGAKMTVLCYYLGSVSHPVNDFPRGDAPKADCVTIETVLRPVLGQKQPRRKARLRPAATSRPRRNAPKAANVVIKTVSRPALGCPVLGRHGTSEARENFKPGEGGSGGITSHDMTLFTILR